MKSGRNTAGQFSAGNSGRPRGSRNKATPAIESRLQGRAEALTHTTVRKALGGDSIALRLCMERVAPAPKDPPVSFGLPKMNNVLEASEAAGSVLEAVSEGELTPIEATRIMGLVDSYRRTLHKRLSNIQAKVLNKPNPEEEAAFHELMAYLDSLAARKASDDKTAQAEIEAVSALLSTK